MSRCDRPDVFEVNRHIGKAQSLVCVVREWLEDLSLPEVKRAAELLREAEQELTMSLQPSSVQS